MTQQLKAVTLLVIITTGLTGCQMMRDPAFGAALMQSSSQYNQQVNQQMLMQQQIWNQQAVQQNQIYMQQSEQQQKAAQELENSSAYNPYKPPGSQYQYIPPGWHKVWDPQHNTWIIQP